MCTMTIKFNQNNALAMSLINAMQQSGAFEILSTQTEEYEDFSNEEEEREAFLHTSRVNAAKMFSKYL